MSILKKMFWPSADPVLPEHVEAAEPPPEKEAEVRAALERMTNAVLKAANHSLAIRTRLAEETLRIVSGD